MSSNCMTMLRKILCVFCKHDLRGIAHAQESPNVSLQKLNKHICINTDYIVQLYQTTHECINTFKICLK